MHIIDDNIHVIPIDGNEHQESETCWCNPYWDEENKLEYQSGLASKKLFIHREIKEIVN